MSSDSFLENIAERARQKAAESDKAKTLKVKRAFEEIEILKNDFLVIDPGIERIVLFGSLASGDVSDDFDIDLAVRSPQYLRIVDRALNSQFRVDVVDLDAVHKEFLKVIEKKGKVIYEKNA